MKTKYFLLSLVGFWVSSLAAGLAFNALLEKFEIAKTKLSFWQVTQMVTIIDLWILLAIVLLIFLIKPRK